MQKIVDDPEHHDQTNWMTSTGCDTACCFAGWALLLDGVSVWDLTRYVDLEMEDDSDPEGIKQVAAQRLGLTGAEAFILFSGGNTRTMLELMVKDLVNGESLQSNIDYLREAFPGSYGYRGSTDV
jgi:hypothetical protein